MQREIKRRIPIYGLAAVLLAIMLGTLVYNIQIRRSEKTPEMQTTEEQVKPAAQLLKTFASYDELRAFLMANSKMLRNFPFLSHLDVGVFGFRTSNGGFAETPAATLEAGVDYSTTNVQVAGVDETDDVKTDEAEKPNTLTILMGSTSSMYVSPENIYITFHESPGETMIYRIRINEGELSIDAKGTVRGRELNQFSMDEHKGYFRMATTTWDNEETQNNVYILDMNLNVVGKLSHKRNHRFGKIHG
ncbi:MAG: beta-propeller domain-containing protein [Nitrososphaerota archaeon]|nr:beta-propeller domain-containing protein [Candidatus Bathyarchaeota archaeon]MDW8193973.1 beta-propeller domain-containing protein [Nitrososphaerota archaeon]